jgi:hypothetical protein
MFLLCRLTGGAFTIDSSTPMFWINLNEHPNLVNPLVIRMYVYLKKKNPY